MYEGEVAEFSQHRSSMRDQPACAGAISTHPPQGNRGPSLDSSHRASILPPWTEVLIRDTVSPIIIKEPRTRETTAHSLPVQRRAYMNGQRSPPSASRTDHPPDQTLRYPADAHPWTGYEGSNSHYVSEDSTNMATAALTASQPDMQITFITIHDTTPQARITFATSSITDILGWQPNEVVGRSSFDYFHPDEIPFAQYVHKQSVLLDKAAVLHYARIRARNGEWITCECIFNVVYDSILATTSIYRGDQKAQQRAKDAKAVRRLFASSPRDPRYHMLEHLSSKFRTPTVGTSLEPRACLIANRFSRDAFIMHSSAAIEDVLGLSSDDVLNMSFYKFMQESCLNDVLRVLESAKANDSTAYLCFRYQDPRQADRNDQSMRDASVSDDSDDGGVCLDGYDDAQAPGPSSSGESLTRALRPPAPPPLLTRLSSGQETDLGINSAEAIFDTDFPQPAAESASSRSMSSSEPRRSEPPDWIEAVVSCASDGLAIVLRRVHPSRIADLAPNRVVDRQRVLFAAPWAMTPIHQHMHQPNQQHVFQHDLRSDVTPREEAVDSCLQAIREMGVFAWALTGINGNLSEYGHGTPRGESQPSVLPVWDPYSQPSPDYAGPTNQAVERWRRMGLTQYEQRADPIQPMSLSRARHHQHHQQVQSPVDRSTPRRAYKPHHARLRRRGSHHQQRGEDRRQRYVRDQIERFGQFTMYADDDAVTRAWQWPRGPPAAG